MGKHKQMTTAIVVTAVISILLTWSVNNYFFYGITDETTNKFRVAAGIIQKNSFVKLTDQQIQEGSIKGLVSSLDDSNSVYLTKEEVAAFQNQFLSEYTGIGIETTKIISGYMILNVMKDSPAQEAGLQQADIIVEINGVKVVEDKNQLISQMLHKKENESIDFKILRSGEQLDIKISKNSIELIDSIKKIKEINGKKIAVLDFKFFSEDAVNILLKEFELLKTEPVDGIVLDLRNNIGGDVSDAQKILDATISNKKPYFTVEDNNGEKHTYTSENKEFIINKPFTILVNEKTASAAEILASAYQEVEGIKLIGNQTAGKGTIQEIFTFNDGSAIKITTKHWLTANNIFLERDQGLNPDFIEIDPIPYKVESIGSFETYKIGNRDLGNFTTIADVQAMLTFFGYLVQRNDGLFDMRTEEQLKKFQADNELEITGVIDQQTLYLINKKILTYTMETKNDPTLQKAMKQMSES